MSKSPTITLKNPFYYEKAKDLARLERYAYLQALVPEEEFAIPSDWDRWSRDPRTALDGLGLFVVSAAVHHAYYESKTTSERHKNRSYNFKTESYNVCLGQVFLRQQEDDVKAAGGDFWLTAELRLQNGRCTCPADSAGYCNHLMAVLENLVLLQNEDYRDASEQLAPSELTAVETSTTSHGTGTGDGLKLPDGRRLST
ncbi:hypothetical protein HPB47_020707 [Ixodes persulcatus]|uniref:Uncharacterized protein n=1 Tax=Ixodes persulcatus TaxID=34615 RepID=A0AC60QEN8_IXOPE|nr:hypothetical protein HPB47_020707 [Ixodes persulcatus]